MEQGQEYPNMEKIVQELFNGPDLHILERFERYVIRVLNVPSAKLVPPDQLKQLLHAFISGMMEFYIIIEAGQHHPDEIREKRIILYVKQLQDFFSKSVEQTAIEAGLSLKEYLQIVEDDIDSTNSAINN